MMSASSFLDLKAELSRKESEFEATRHMGSTTQGLVKRPGKKPSAWQQQPKNKGVAARNAKDMVLHETESVKNGTSSEFIQAQLARKAALYDKIRKGKSAGLSEDQIDSLLVDFDQRPGGDDDDDDDESDSSEDESAVASRPSESDPLVEWTDEFGRSRMIRRSEMPRGAGLPPTEVEPDNTAVQYGDQHIFPVYVPSEDLLEQRRQALGTRAPLVQHYDASTENRTRGAGFMAFSKDEDVRQEQMAALKRERDETVRRRDEVQETGGAMGERDREREQRKRKLELKRRELEAKRAKK